MFNYDCVSFSSSILNVPYVIILSVSICISSLLVWISIILNDGVECIMNHICVDHLYCWLPIFTSLAKEVMFLVALVSLSVCLFVCAQHYSKSYERIGMKFYGRVLSSTRKN